MLLMCGGGAAIRGAGKDRVIVQTRMVPAGTERPGSGEFGFQRVWGTVLIGQGGIIELGVSAGGIKLWLRACGHVVRIDGSEGQYTSGTR